MKLEFPSNYLHATIKTHQQSNHKITATSVISQLAVACYNKPYIIESV